MKRAGCFYRRFSARVRAAVLCALMLIPGMGTVARAETDEELTQQGIAFMKQNLPEEAIGCFSQALARNPRNYLAHNYLGYVYVQEKRDHDEAIGHFKKAIEIRPTYTDAYNNLAMVYGGREQWELARDTLDELLAIEPDNAKGHYYLGWIYLSGIRDPYRSAEHFQKARQAIGDNPQLVHSLGTAYVLSGQRPQVLEIITLLRDMKQDALAVNLEAMLRQHDAAGTPEHSGVRDPGQSEPAMNRQPAEKMVISGSGAITVRSQFFNRSQPSQAP